MPTAGRDGRDHVTQKKGIRDGCPSTRSFDGDNRTWKLRCYLKISRLGGRIAGIASVILR